MKIGVAKLPLLWLGLVSAGAFLGEVGRQEGVEWGGWRVVSHGGGTEGGEEPPLCGH